MSGLRSHRHLPSLHAAHESRRDFLAWLGIGTALTVVGCSTSTEDDRLTPRAYGGDGEEPVDLAEQAQTACLPIAFAPNQDGRERALPVRDSSDGRRHLHLIDAKIGKKVGKRTRFEAVLPRS